MSDSTNNSLHKEFELERMILFSDAVFAIAITLLIIEIKFPELPENYKESLDLFRMFKPTLIHFTGFLLSFVLIGMSWVRHLKMFRYLKAYDNQVIVRNLLSLLFIVIFPFVANGLTHSKPGFMFPVILYLANLMCIFISNFLLAHYIFKSNPTLTIPGHEPDKNYIYMQNKIMALMLILSFLIVLLTAIITNFDNKVIALSFYGVPFLAVIARRWIKKYKPKKITVAA